MLMPLRPSHSISILGFHAYMNNGELMHAATAAADGAMRLCLPWCSEQLLVGLLRA